MKMRNIICALLALLMLVTVAACAATPAETSQSPSSSPSASASASPSPSASPSASPAASPSAPPDTSPETGPEPVTIRWLQAGRGKQEDTDKVLEAFNDLLPEQMPNTTLELTQVTYNDFSERWQLAAASRDPFDIGWMGWTLSLGFEVANGSVMPLDDLINNYAPVLWEIMPAWAYDVNRVAGKLYAIPNNQLLVDPPSGAYMPKELADKYMDKAAFERAAKAWFD